MMKKLLFVLLYCLSFLAYSQDTENRLFLEAEGRFDNREYELALDLYNNFVRDFPQSAYVADAQFRRGMCAYYLGRYDQALSTFERVGKRYKSTRFLEYLPFWEGLTLYHLQEYEQAITTLKRFVAQTQDKSFAHRAGFYIGLSYAALGNRDQAIQVLEVVVQGDKPPVQDPTAALTLISLYLKEGEARKILDLIQKLEQEIPAGNLEWTSQLKLYKAEALWASGRMDEAEPLYLELTKSTAKLASIAFQRLFSYYLARQKEDQLTDLLVQAEVKLAGNITVLKEFWLRIGIESYKLGKLDNAESYLIRVWNLRNSTQISDLVPLYLAEVYAKQKRDNKAIDVLLAYKDRAQEHKQELLVLLERTYLTTEKWDKVIESVDEQFKAFPDTPFFAQISYYKAFSLYKEKQFEKALSMVSTVFTKGNAGRYAAKLFRLQSVLERKLGRMDPAIESLRQYLTLSPKDFEARLDLLKYLFDNKLYQQVIEEGEKMDKAFPALKERSPSVYVMAHYLYGLSLISEKRYQDSLAVLNELVKVKTEDSDSVQPYIQFYIGWSLYRLAKYHQAKEEFAKLLSRTKDSSLEKRAAYLAGWCAYTTGQFTAGLGYLQRFSSYSAVDDEDIKGRLLYAKCLAGLDRYDEAQLVLQNIYRRHSSSKFAAEAMFEHAYVLAKLGDIDGAAAEYKDLFNRFKQNPLASEALYKRGELYYTEEKYPQAVAAFFEFRSNFPKEELVDAALFWGAMASNKMGEPYGALLLWNKLINDFRDSSFRSDAIIQAALLYKELGEYDKAYELYRELLALYPEEAERVGADLESKKLELLMAGKTEKEAELSIIIGREGGNATAEGRHAMVELSRLYIYKSGSKQEAAFSMLNEVVKKKTEDQLNAARAQYLLGEYYYRKGELATAANEFIQAAIMNPADRDFMAASMYRAAEVTKLAGKPAETRSLVKKIEENFPGSEWSVAAGKLLEAN